MSTTDVDITKCNLKKFKFSLPENVGGYIRSGVGYDKLEPKLAPEEGGKYLSESDYVYLLTPPMRCYGIHPTYEYQKPRTEENINGYQVIVPLTSNETVDNPTPVETKCINFFNGIRDQLIEFMVENQGELPDNYAAVSADNMGMMVHPFITRPKKEPDENDPKRKTKKVEDDTKPLHLYLPLIYYKKTGTFGSNMYGPGDKQVDPLKYHKVRGTIQMVIRIRYVNYGKKAGMNMQLFEANYIPDKQAPRQRRLAANTAPEEDDVEAPSLAPRPPTSAGTNNRRNLTAASSYNPDKGDKIDVPDGGGDQPRYKIVMRNGKKVRVRVKEEDDE